MDNIFFFLFCGILQSIVGCKIPADLRVIEILSDHLRVDQAILTGIVFALFDGVCVVCLSFLR